MSDLEKCKKYLRSILLASKGGILAARVFDSYKDMVGEGIPYRRFNFSSLETFLQSIPDVCRITFKGKDIYVVGVASAETKHIEKLVQKQGGKPGGGGARRGAKARTDDWKQFYPGAGASTAAIHNNSMRRSSPSEKSSSSKSSKSITNGGGPMKIETKRAPAPVRIVPKRVSTQQTHANGNGPVMSTNVIPVTKQSIKTWTARVKKLLEGRPHGLMKSQVEKFYEKQWDEKLPCHWSDVMLEDEIIVMKRESNQSNYIVALKSLSTQTVQAVDNSVAIPSGGYPTSSNWTVTITNVVSTAHLWVMFGDAPLKLEALQRVMEMRHKAGQAFSGGQMPPGNYFSAKLNSGEFVRVKVSKVDRMNHSCHCFLVDYGKEKQIDWGQLTNLHKDFITLPSMAMKVILSGVENSKEPELVEHVRNKLVGNKLRAIEVENGVNNIPIIHLFDGDDVVQEDLAKQLKKLSLASEQQKTTVNNNSYSVPNRNGNGSGSCLSSPSLPGVGEFYDLKISHIVSLREMYAQSYTSLAKYAVMTQNMNRHYQGADSRDGVDNVLPGMLVAVNLSGDWRRAQVIVEMETSSKMSGQDVIVKLMDSGEAVTVNINEIKQLDERFTELPVQAVKFKLSSIELSEEAASVWLRRFCEGKGLVGMIDAKIGSLLSVTLYDTNNINQDININKELQKLGLAN